MRPFFVIAMALLTSSCDDYARRLAAETEASEKAARVEKAEFKNRCEAIGGIVQPRCVDNWFSGARCTEECALPSGPAKTLEQGQ